MAKAPLFFRWVKNIFGNDFARSVNSLISVRRKSPAVCGNVAMASGKPRACDEPASGLSPPSVLCVFRRVAELALSRLAFEFDQSLVFSNRLDRQRGADGIEGKV